MTATETETGPTARPRRTLLLGLLGGFIVGLVVVAAIGAFVWPGNAFGPGSPDQVASEATTALAAKDSATLDALSCRGADGTLLERFDPQLFGVITAAKPAGRAHLLIDSEARAPVDFTITYQGASQPLGADVILGESGRAWCFKGITQR